MSNLIRKVTSEASEIRTQNLVISVDLYHLIFIDKITNRMEYKMTVVEVSSFLLQKENKDLGPCNDHELLIKNSFT